MRASRSPFRWLAALAALALAPKCALCVLAYAGVGTAALGLSRVEMCGPPEGGFHTAIPWLVVASIISGGGAFLVRRHLRRHDHSTPVRAPG